MAIDEAREVEHFERYWQQNKGTMDAVSLEATWLALKGACTVKRIPGGVRINGVTDKYQVYNVILMKHSEKYKLSPGEQRERMTELAQYAKMKLVG